MLCFSTISLFTNYYFVFDKSSSEELIQEYSNYNIQQETSVLDDLYESFSSLSDSSSEETDNTYELFCSLSDSSSEDETENYSSNNGNFWIFLVLTEINKNYY